MAGQSLLADVADVLLEIGPAQRRGGAVGAEAAEECHVAGRQIGVSERLLRLRHEQLHGGVLRIDGQRLGERVGGITEMRRGQVRMSDLLPDQRLPRVLRDRLPQLDERALVIAGVLLHQPEVEVGAGERRRERQGALELGARRLQVAHRPIEIAQRRPAVGIAWPRRQQTLIGLARREVVGLVGEGESVIVPPLAVALGQPPRMLHVWQRRT